MKITKESLENLQKKNHVLKDIQITLKMTLEDLKDYMGNKNIKSALIYENFLAKD